MNRTEFDVVTGAFSYTGRYVTRLLLRQGRAVRTLTSHPSARMFGGAVGAAPYNFDRPDDLARSLEGANTLYNTYWVRFARGELTHDVAVRNITTMLRAAESAGVRRAVHVSITNAVADSSLPYFRGKALAEEAVRASEMSHAILRPTVIFGREDLLLNNIAWTLRRFPFFPVFGRGDYRVQPIYVGDHAALMVEAGQREDNYAIDSVGPEVFTYEEMVRLIAGSIGASVRVAHVGKRLGMLMTGLVGLVVRDVTLTRDEVEGLMADLLVSRGEPTGETRLSDWLAESGADLGKGYVSELDRHYRAGSQGTGSGDWR